VKGKVLVKSIDPIAGVAQYYRVAFTAASACATNVDNIVELDPNHG
jgi:hypothetical protein